MFKNIHDNATPNTIRGLLVVREVLSQEVNHFLFLDDFFSLIKKEMHVPNRHSRSLVGEV